MPLSSVRTIRISFFHKIGALFVLLWSVSNPFIYAAEPLMDSAQFYFDKGHYGDALETYDQIIEATPTIGAAYLGKARSLIKLNRNQEALKVVQRLLAGEPLNQEALLLKARLEANAGRHDQAIFISQRILKHNPMEERAWLQLGKSQFATKQLNAALFSFHRCQDVLNRKQGVIPSSFNSELAYQLGLAYQAHNNREKALSYFKEAVTLDPWDEKPPLQLGMLLAKEGKTQNSRKWLSRHTRLKQANQLIHSFRQLVAHHPQLVTPYVNMGNVYASIKAWDQAEKAFRQATEVNPQFAPAFFGLGTISLQEQNKEQAYEAFKKVVALNPRHIRALVHLADLEHEKGNLDQAQDLYLNALQINPNFSPAQRGFSRIQSIKSQLKQQEAILR